MFVLLNTHNARFNSEFRQNRLCVVEVGASRCFVVVTLSSVAHLAPQKGAGACSGVTLFTCLVPFPASR